jgi:hypothetical protein
LKSAIRRYIQTLTCREIIIVSMSRCWPGLEGATRRRVRCRTQNVSMASKQLLPGCLLYQHCPVLGHHWQMIDLHLGYGQIHHPPTHQVISLSTGTPVFSKFRVHGKFFIFKNGNSYLRFQIKSHYEYSSRSVQTRQF